MGTCAVSFKLASSIVFHSPTDFLWIVHVLYQSCKIPSTSVSMYGHWVGGFLVISSGDGQVGLTVLEFWCAALSTRCWCFEPLVLFPLSFWVVLIYWLVYLLNVYMKLPCCVISPSFHQQSDYLSFYQVIGLYLWGGMYSPGTLKFQVVDCVLTVVLGSCCDLLLGPPDAWHWCCVMPLSPRCSSIARSSLVLLFPHRWEYTLDGSMRNRPFILIASASLEYLVNLVARPVSLCLSVFRSISYEYLIFIIIEDPSLITPFHISVNWLNVPLDYPDFGFQPSLLVFINSIILLIHYNLTLK